MKDRIQQVLRETIDLNKSTYYISTGALSGFYTLRVRFNERVYFRTGDGEGGIDSQIVTRDYFIRNLSTDPEIAKQKAFEYMGKHLDINFTLEDIARRKAGSIDWSIFQAGKYRGLSIVEVLEKDKDYVLWACENLATQTSYEKTIELAKAYIEHELNDRHTQREEKKSKEEDQKQKIIQTTTEIANQLEDGKGGFRDSIARDLRKGVIPAGRGFNIMVDILSKIHGRRNSKAYSDRYQELFDLFDSFEHHH
jgi:hypothetical protein